MDRVNAPLNRVANKLLTSKNEYRISSYESKFIISATTGVGVAALLTALEAKAAEFLTGSESALITRARHRRALEDTLAALRRTMTRPAADHEDLLAEDFRLAARSLARLTGRVDVEDILDVIFRDFCIGK